MCISESETMISDSGLRVQVSNVRVATLVKLLNLKFFTPKKTCEEELKIIKSSSNR